MAGRSVAGDQWVQRVLGVAPGLPGSSPTGAPKPPPGATPGQRIDRRALWRDAKETVDDALNALGTELRSFGNPDLDRIAEFGLFGLGKGENVALAKALIEYDTAPEPRREAAGKALRQAIAGYRAILTGHPAVRQIDTNPFGVSVTMAATLGGALDRIEHSL